MCLDNVTGASGVEGEESGIAGSFIASRAPMSTDFIAFCRAPSAAPVAASATREARSGSQHCGGGAGGGGGEYGGKGGGRSTRSGAWAGSAGVQRQCHWSTTGGTSVCSTASLA